MTIADIKKLERDSAVPHRAQDIAKQNVRCMRKSAHINHNNVTHKHIERYPPECS